MLPILGAYKNKKVFVGVSGGVDSALAAAILKDSGAEVTGVFLKNWAGEAGLQLDCPWKEDQDAAQAVCDFLKIPFLSFNFEREYKQNVLDYFFAEYKAGRTPNPDILCNSQIKFKAFLEKAIIQGADYIATGHYAATELVSWQEDNFKAILLSKPKDQNKDQTYFLSDLSQSQLEKTVFPLAKLEKTAVRKLAAQVGLPNFNRPDSQGICFIGDLDVASFLRKYISKTEGDIVDIETNKIIGKHEGLAFYTIGQREGLQIGGSELPYYVAAKELGNNQLLVAKGKHNPALFKQVVEIENIHWLSDKLAEIIPNQQRKYPLQASLRYRHPAQPGILDLANHIFTFNEAQRAVTPGQSLVFFTGNYCLGRAIIK